MSVFFAEGARKALVDDSYEATTLENSRGRPAKKTRARPAKKTRARPDMHMQPSKTCLAPRASVNAFVLYNCLRFNIAALLFQNTCIAAPTRTPHELRTSRTSSNATCS